MYKKSYFPPDNVPAVWKVGDVFPGGYTVTAILGQGGMGTVYKVVHPRWKEMAVKSPRAEIFAGVGSQEAFIREAETWARLAPHPHIVLCYFVVVMGGIPHIFTEYVDGGSLDSWIRQRTLYLGGTQDNLRCILDVTIQFAWGLHAAHEQGLVHQDVKPANVMLTRQRMVKVTDFGLAKARALSGEGQAKAAAGKQSVLVSVGGMTPAYCSPEQAAGQALGRRTDIWSWAVSVLEMFVGGVTWDLGPAAREVLARHERRDALIPPMPREVANLLSRCLQWQPEARPASMLEVATELQAIYARLLGSAYPRKTPQLAAPDAAMLRNKGLSLLELDRAEEALLAFEQAIRLGGPIDAPTYAAKGLSLVLLDRAEEALLAFEKAIRLDPKDARIYDGKGLSLVRLGRYKEALGAFEQAIRLDPTDVQSREHKNILLRKLNERGR